MGHRSKPLPGPGGYGKLRFLQLWAATRTMTDAASTWGA